MIWLSPKEQGGQVETHLYGKAALGVSVTLLEIWYYQKLRNLNLSEGAGLSWVLLSAAKPAITTYIVAAPKDAQR